MKNVFITLAILFVMCSQAFAFIAPSSGVGNAQKTVAGPANTINVIIPGVPIDALVTACLTWTGGSSGNQTIDDGPAAPLGLTGLSESSYNTTHAKAFYLLRSLKTGSVTYTANFTGYTTLPTNISLLVQAFQPQRGSATFFSSRNGANNGTAVTVGPYSDPVGPTIQANLCINGSSVQNAQKFGIYSALGGSGTGTSSLYFFPTVMGYNVINGNATAVQGNLGSLDWAATVFTFYEYNALPFHQSFSTNCTTDLTRDVITYCGATDNSYNLQSNVNLGHQQFATFDQRCTQYVYGVTGQYLHSPGYDPCTFNPGDGLELGDHYEEIKQPDLPLSPDGGRSQRHWYGYLYCPDPCGLQSGYNVPSPNNSSGLEIAFNPYAQLRDIWFGAWVRWQAGWQWGGLGNMKLWYPQGADLDAPTLQSHTYGPVIHFPQSLCTSPCQVDTGGNNIYLGQAFTAQNGDTQNHGCSGCGWKDIYPTGTSDGRWGYIKYHFHMNDPGQANGYSEAWVNGTKLSCYISPTQTDTCNNVRFSPLSVTSPFFSHLHSFDNGSAWKGFNLTGTHYVDMDGFTVSATDYPDPFLTSPAPPINFRIIP